MNKLISSLVSLAILTSACQTQTADQEQQTTESSTVDPTAESELEVTDLTMIFADEYHGITVDDLLTSCGSIDYDFVKKDEVLGKDKLPAGFTYTSSDGTYLGSYTHPAGDPNGLSWSAWSGLTPVLSVTLNESAKAGDLFEIKWTQTSFIQTMEEPTLLQSKTVEATACSDGTLAISDSLDAGMGGYKVEIYHEGTLLSETSFSLAQ